MSALLPSLYEMEKNSILWILLLASIVLIVIIACQCYIKKFRFYHLFVIAFHILLSLKLYNIYQGSYEELLEFDKLIISLGDIYYIGLMFALWIHTPTLVLWFLKTLKKRFSDKIFPFETEKPKSTVIRFTPHRGTLEEAMKEYKEFRTIEELKEYVLSYCISIYVPATAEQVLISENMLPYGVAENRTGWKEWRYVSIKDQGVVGHCSIEEK